MDKSVAIIGGGPAGLMAAEVISARGVKVDVYDSMPSVGRKFLMAGKSGLNITHSDPFDEFVTRYGKRRPQIEPMLKNFGAQELRAWVHSFGIETFVGTSGRVFPVGMKASPLLRVWIQRLTASGVIFHLRHKLTAILPDRSLRFVTPDGEVTVKADAVVIALAPDGPARAAVGELLAHATAWGARTIEVGPERLMPASDLLPLPTGAAEEHAPLIAVPPVALLGFALARVRGANPDRPDWIERYHSQGLTHILVGGQEATS